MIGPLMMHLHIHYAVRQGDWGGYIPPLHWGGPNLPDMFPKMDVADPVPIRGVPGWGFKSYQPLGSLFAPSCAGHDRDPGGG